ncbi:MAG: HAMP domain-containing histidine kinase [Candidatus Gastranaerophilales bacterium]|nr:HAMP domain-containing histidine kinase [Candidatus Gastranaerophilales bacterium]
MNNNIKDEFISTLSHEIRTPLTSIKGFSQTMLSSWDKIDDEKKKEFIEIIHNQSQRLINLCENVLNVAKIDSNTEKIIYTKIDINKIVQNSINITNVNHKNFNFTFEKSKNEIFSLADNDKVQQILLNILDNACKYSINSNEINIKTYSENDFNIISVKNFGNYIENDKLEKIFEKFYRIDSYISTTTQGSGLGLYIAKNLIEKMQGNIKVFSNKDKKETEFLVYLPIYEVEKLTKTIGV